MITVKLTRDEARAMQQYFFHYLHDVCCMKERQATDMENKMSEHLIKDTFHQVRIIFEKKLFNKGNNIKFNFTDSQAIILYKLLLHIGIDDRNVWLQQLRQLFCNLLYEQIVDIINLYEIKTAQAAAAV